MSQVPELGQRRGPKGERVIRKGVYPLFLEQQYHGLTPLTQCITCLVSGLVEYIYTASLLT